MTPLRDVNYFPHPVLFLYRSSLSFFSPLFFLFFFSGAQLRVAKDDGDGIRKVMISGTKSQVQKCKALIKEKTGKKLQSAKKHSAKRRKTEGAARL